MNRPADFLEAEARTRRASLLLPTGELKPDVRSEVRALVRQHGATLSDLAAAADCDAATVRAVLDGEQDDDAILRKLNDFVETDAAQRAESEAEFVMTRVASRLLGGGKQAIARRDIVLAHGPTGIGKSVAARALCDEIPGAAYCCVRRVSASMSGLMDALTGACNARPGVRIRKGYGALTKYAGRAVRLFIIDQIHRAQSSALELVMDVFDETGVPFLLIGTDVALRRFDAEGDPFGGQLSSRVGLRVNLWPDEHRSGGRGVHVFTVEDVRAMFQRGGLKLHPDAARMLAEIANRELGAMRRAARIVGWAAALATKRGLAMVTAECVRRAIGFVDGLAPMAAAATPAAASASA